MFEESLEQLGITITNLGEREVEAQCPFHDDVHPSFYMNRRTGLFICFQCQASGTFEMLIEDLGGSGTNHKELLRQVRQKRTRRVVVAPEPVLAETPENDPILLTARYETFKVPPPWALKERHLKDAAIEQFGVRWDRGWITPIWSAGLEEPSSLMGWQWKRMREFMNVPKAVKKSVTLFGIRQLTTPVAVIVESPLDVVRLGSVGIPALSTFGALVSAMQLQVMVEKLDRIFLALDNDEEGQRQTSKIYPQLHSRIGIVRRVKMPDGVKDPGECSDRQLARMFADVHG